MTKSSYNLLLKNRSQISATELLGLENLLLEFPYSQNIRQLYLKALYQNEHYKFENELKKVAIYSNNRKQLKYLIEGERAKSKYIQFKKVAVLEAEIIEQPTELKEVEESIEKTRHPDLTEYVNQSIISEVINASISLEVTPEKGKEVEPEIVVEKLNEEKLSFVEWLKKTKTQQLQKQVERSDFKKKAEALIEEFISKQPKIVAKRDFYSPLNMAKKSVESDNELASETLAKIYAQQGNYSKAINTYETLILKFPEKMAFFASQINQIKNLPKK